MEKQQLEKFAQPLVNLFNELEKEMLVNMASKLYGKTNLLKDDPETWKLHQLHQLGLLDKDNLNRIKSMLGITSAQLNQLLYDAGMEGLNENEEEIAKAVKKGAKLRVPPPINESPQILKIMQAYGAQAANVFNLVNQTMLIKAKQMYTDGLNKAVLDVLSGFKTHDQALSDTIRQWAENGIPALVDKAGKKWGVEGYVRTVIISSIGNATNQMQDQRMKEWGIDLIEVSSHSGARPLCAKFQGRIFSVSGTSQKYPPLSSTSYGKPAGLFGINCGHVKYPFIEGVSEQTYKPYSPLKNAKVYKESQIQRAHERGIRKAKTQYEMYKAAGDQDGMDKATALIKQRQGKLRDFIKDTGRTRRRDREQIHTNKLPKDKPTTPFPDPGMPKVVKKTKTVIDTPKQDMQVKQTASPDPVLQQEPVKHEPYVPKIGDAIKYKKKDGEGLGVIAEQEDNFYIVKNGDNKDYVHKTSIIGKADDTASKPVTQVEVPKANPVLQQDSPSDYKVVHKENIWQSKDGTIRSENEVYAVKGKGKTKEEIKLGKVEQSYAQKKVKGKEQYYNSTDGYIATLNDGTQGKFKTQKAAKEWMLDKHLADKGIIKPPKTPMKPVQAAPVTKTVDPIPAAPEVKAYKPKLMDEVTFDHNGKKLEGKIMDIDKASGQVQIMTPDKKFITVHKDAVTKKGDIVQPAKPTAKVPEPDPVNVIAKEPKLPEPTVTTTTKPKKDIKDVTTGDTIKFYDYNGDVLVGKIEKKYTSGKILLEDEHGLKHKIDSGKMIEHLPEEVEEIDYDSFMKLEIGDEDIKRDGKTIANKMDPSESRYIDIYSGSAYRRINTYLRTNGREYSDDSLAVEAATELHDVIKQYANPLTKNSMFFRNMDRDALPHIFGKAAAEALGKAANSMDIDDIERARSMVVGGAMQDKGFVSSTYKKGSFGSGMDVAFEIYAPKGYRGGMFIEEISQFSSEREYLFNSGTKFKILDVEPSFGKIIFKIMPE